MGFETLDSLDQEAKEFIANIRGKLSDVTGEPQTAAYLMQRISLELQRGNVASVLGTYVQKDNIDSLFCFPRRRHP